MQGYNGYKDQDSFSENMADGLLLQLVWSLSGAHGVSLLPKVLLRPRREGTNCDTCDTMVPVRIKRTQDGKNTFRFLTTILQYQHVPFTIFTLFYGCSPAPFHHIALTIAPLDKSFGCIQVFPGLCHCLCGNWKGNRDNRNSETVVRNERTWKEIKRT